MTRSCSGLLHQKWNLKTVQQLTKTQPRGLVLLKTWYLQKNQLCWWRSEWEVGGGEGGEIISASDDGMTPVFPHTVSIIERKDIGFCQL